MTVIICPDPFDRLVRATYRDSRAKDGASKTIGYFPTAHGAACCDSYRLHWDCPDEELNETHRGLMSHLADASVAD